MLIVRFTLLQWTIVISLIGCIIYFPIPSEALTKPSGIKLSNNGYTGIVVAIHPDEEVNSKLIEIIKQMFINGSAFLYNATNQRAFFKQVTILIPQSWPDHHSYGFPGNATYDGADVIVSPRNHRFAPKASVVAKPYTKQFEGCGKRGLYIHLTSPFLLNYGKHQARFGNYGRVLVHEWGHLRWGLFDESPDPIVHKDYLNYFYYSANNKLWEPSTCSAGWRMHPLKYTGDTNRPYRPCTGNLYDGYEEGCISVADQFQPNVKGSIMHGHLNFEQVTQFCDSSAHDHSYAHNSEAPNKHNRLCAKQSCWEVMRQHHDFKDDNNPPRQISDVTPTFNIVRAESNRIVLVLDTSANMSTNNRMTKQASATKDFISAFAADGSYIGIVDFDDEGRITSHLREIDTDHTRQELSEMIPDNANGGTCIGCGLERALEILSDNVTSSRGGKVVLITNGQDHEPHITENMRRKCITQGVIIDTMAFSEEADERVIALSESTGGKFYLQTDDHQSTGFYELFNDLTNSGQQSYHRRIEIYSSVLSFKPGQPQIRDSLYIDPTIGRKTTFAFKYFIDMTSPNDSAITVTVLSPSGIKYNCSYAGYVSDLTKQKVTVNIESVAEPGSWEFIIFNQKTDKSNDVVVSITSFPADENVEPIIISAYLSGSVTDMYSGKPLVVYAEVRQNYDPIINATVVAIVERPPDIYGTVYQPVELELLDNGAGADITREDGIYSRYFTDITGIGYYGLKLRVNNSGKAVVLTSSTGSKFSQLNPSFFPTGLTAEDLLGQNFSNFDGLLPGEPIPDYEYRPAPNFTRQGSAGASRVSTTPDGWSSSVDTLSPNDITDLTVISTSYSNATVTIKFTAPGGDLDHGRADRYIFHRASTSHDLVPIIAEGTTIPREEVLSGNPNSPSYFGSIETFILRAPIPATDNVNIVSYVFAVYAIDDSDNRGALSNLVQATLRRLIPSSKELPIFNNTSHKGNQSSSSSSSPSSSSPLENIPAAATEIHVPPTANVLLPEMITSSPTDQVIGMVNVPTTKPGRFLHTTMGRTECPSEWQRFGESCYRFFADKIPWQESVANCENYGGYLVEIQSEEENIFVGSIAAQVAPKKKLRAWIGLKLRQGGDTFTWRIRKDVWRTATFHNWKNAEHIKKKLSNRCVEINRHDFNIWKNTACTKELGYVCEI